MTVLVPPLDTSQRRLVSEVVRAVGAENLDGLRPLLAKAEADRVWVTPPLLVVSAAVIQVITAGLTDHPWDLPDDPWSDYLPDARPTSRSGWRKTSYALQAAGCLAGGVWLDVGATESFWTASMWPEALDVLELLIIIARARLDLGADALTDQLAITLTRALPAPA